MLHQESPEIPMANPSQNMTNWVEDVRGSGIYPATGPLPSGDALVRSPAALGHPAEHPRTAARTATLERAAMLLGRAVFGGYFLYNGVNHFLNRKMLAEHARMKGVLAPDIAVPASGMLILAGGLSILTGVRPKWGAASIATFLLAVSPQMHAFWKAEDEQQRMRDMIDFTKNMALVGASLLAAGHPEPWPWRLIASPAVSAVAQ
jgi:putative oxidoreductase